VQATKRWASQKEADGKREEENKTLTRVGDDATFSQKPGDFMANTFDGGDRLERDDQHFLGGENKLGYNGPGRHDYGRPQKVGLWDTICFDQSSSLTAREGDHFDHLRNTFIGVIKPTF